MLVFDAGIHALFTPINNLNRHANYHIPSIDVHDKSIGSYCVKSSPWDPLRSSTAAVIKVSPPKFIKEGTN